MGNNSGGKRRVFDDAFRREPVRILATNDRTMRQVAGDLVDVHPVLQRITVVLLLQLLSVAPNEQRPDNSQLEPSHPG
jgi:hypothetical protein